MAKALEGIRALDLTKVLAGPFCAYHLVSLGAGVIGIEVPEGGDLARQPGADSGLNRRGMGASFLARNSGKQSLALNPKSGAGRPILLRLAASAGAPVESFRPAVMDRPGIGDDALQTADPRSVYCAVSGFGQTGPLGFAPARDQIIQGLSGAMSIAGSKEPTPLRAGYPVADTIGGMTAARLGEHADPILAEPGYSRARITRFHAIKAI